MTSRADTPRRGRFCPLGVEAAFLIKPSPKGQCFLLWNRCITSEGARASGSPGGAGQCGASGGPSSSPLGPPVCALLGSGIKYVPLYGLQEEVFGALPRVQAGIWVAPSWAEHYAGQHTGDTGQKAQGLREGFSGCIDNARPFTPPHPGMFLVLRTMLNPCSAFWPSSAMFVI